MSEKLLSLAREVGADTDFSPVIEFPNLLALQDFAELIRQDTLNAIRSSGTSGRRSDE